MDFSSLPKFPAHQYRSSTSATQQRRLGLSPRIARILRDLLLLALFGLMLYHLRQMTAERPPPPPRVPFDFKLVQARIDEVRMRDAGEVEALLGPPGPNQSREPEFELIEAVVAVHRDRYPSGDCLWTKWTDPNDEGKWVAIFFAGGKAYHVLKSGF
jgi:hypothetical protein